MQRRAVPLDPKRAALAPRTRARLREDELRAHGPQQAQAHLVRGAGPGGELV